MVPQDNPASGQLQGIYVKKNEPLPPLLAGGSGACRCPPESAPGLDLCGPAGTAPAASAREPEKGAKPVPFLHAESGAGTCAGGRGRTMKRGGRA